MNLSVRPISMKLNAPTVPDLCDCVPCEFCGDCMCHETDELACNLIACPACHYRECPDKGDGCWGGGFFDE